MAKKAVDDVLGINIPQAPEMSVAAPAAPTDAAATNNANDEAASATAKKRLEEEKLRRGRSALRVDSTSQTGGAGVTIAK